jgi:hypothetical protein
MPRSLRSRTSPDAAFQKLWAARFDELDEIAEELKQKEKAHGRESAE